MFLDTDKQLTLFTSEGKLSQCDNALKASAQGTLSISIKSKDGVVLASLKESPPLTIKQAYTKVFKLPPNILLTYAGLQPDFRIQYNMALDICESYRDIYNTVDINVFVETFSRKIQEYTIKKGYRPFGTLILISNDKFLYRIDPSGSYSLIEVGSIGREYVESSKFLERRKGMLDDNITTCVECMKEYAGYSINCDDVDIGICNENGSKIFSREEVQEVFDSLSTK
ncbi:proteasome subunit alpha type-2-a [Vairimorpha apis BRL 01]|uniref:Proteasome subunit alpha type-2-a n=1 Tax=Vairimorpha apis BRL 01 TaxID=1037528 RepID=T0M9W3_9MICR|nr:proteasome subunit alpha type-2-a [Vairimorpha apis BRL 01]